jgi:peroxiredoxin
MRSILQVLTGVFIVVLFILIISLDRKNEKINRLTSENEQLMNEKEDLLAVRNFRNTEILFNGRELSKDTHISDGKGNRVEWDEITGKLVFYFSETACDMCVDMEIARLNEQAELAVSDNTVILISAISKRYVAQYKNNNKLKFPVYEIKSVKEDFLPSLPFYFIIDRESKRINSSFFPSKYTPDETDKYLNKIAEDYFR